MVKSKATIDVALQNCTISLFLNIYYILLIIINIRLFFLITKIIADSGYICHIFINTVNDPRTNLQLLLAKTTLFLKVNSRLFTGYTLPIFIQDNTCINKNKIKKKTGTLIGTSC